MKLKYIITFVLLLLVSTIHAQVSSSNLSIDYIHKTSVVNVEINAGSEIWVYPKTSQKNCSHKFKVNNSNDSFSERAYSMLITAKVSEVEVSFGLMGVRDDYCQIVSLNL